MVRPCLLLIGLPFACGDALPPAAGSLNALARSYLTVPYRSDGATDTRGRYVTFGKPTEEHTEPGLNCSGLVVDFARKALREDFSLGEVTVDRQDNSGPDARYGEDWDFGRDLILNITEGRSREFVGPVGEAGTDGLPAVGFSLHSRAAWREALARLHDGKIYFASFSKPWYGRKRYQVIHFHVALVIRESEQHVWLYHATRVSGVHRYNLASAEGMAQLAFQFPRSRFGDKHVLLIGVAP